MLIVFVMGPNNVGKTTLFDWIVERYPDSVGDVRVGAYMRAKYLDPKSPHYDPDHFKGQAAPEHTREEAWSMCYEGIRGHVESRKTLILVDGQPRSVDQVEHCLHHLPFDWPRKFVLLHASERVRLERLAARFDLPRQQAEYDLAVPRIKNDMVTYYTVLAELLRHNERVKFFDADSPNRQAIVDWMFDAESAHGLRLR